MEHQGSNSKLLPENAYRKLNAGEEYKPIVGPAAGMTEVSRWSLTMAVIMVAGNQARMPAGLLKGVRTLTANIINEMGYAAELHREALIATGVVLFVFILLINLLLSLLKRRTG